jgi:SAM-dependent methyltransferase
MTMMNMNEADLTSVETHFAFGRNWAEFSEKVDEAEIGEAERGLRRLIEEKEIVSRSFLDIGCGSGLHALAALRLGQSAWWPSTSTQIQWPQPRQCSNAMPLRKPRETGR